MHDPRQIIKLIARGEPFNATHAIRTICILLDHLIIDPTPTEDAQPAAKPTKKG